MGKKKKKEKAKGPFTYFEDNVQAEMQEAILSTEFLSPQPFNQLYAFGAARA